MCADCKWWDTRSTDGTRYGADKKHAGLCRLNPPQPMLAGYVSMATPWPITYSQDWCGKFAFPAAAEPKT
jgi:hypothetical protein